MARHVTEENFKFALFFCQQSYKEKVFRNAPISPTYMNGISLQKKWYLHDLNDSFELINQQPISWYEKRQDTILLTYILSIKFRKHLQSQDADKLSNLSYESERQAYDANQSISRLNISKFPVEINKHLHNSESTTNLNLLN